MDPADGSLCARRGPEEWLPAGVICENFSVHFRLRRKCPSEASERAPEEKPHRKRIPALQRAYEFQALLESGAVNNKAEIARQYGLSRARVTQILNLLKLPAQVLDYIEELPREEQLWYSERRLRRIAALESGEEQMKEFECIQSTRQGSA